MSAQLIIPQAPEKNPLAGPKKSVLDSAAEDMMIMRLDGKTIHSDGIREKADDDDDDVTK